MEQQKDEATCYASVCARLETSTAAAPEGQAVTVQAVHQDVAAVATGLQISIIDVRVSASHATLMPALLLCNPVGLCR